MIRWPEWAAGMRGIGIAGVAILLTVLLAGEPRVTATSSLAPAGWAVLIELNSFGPWYPSLPVGYINSTRMLTALVRRGWPADHVLLMRDNHDLALLQRATDWLAARVRPGDTAVLYVAGEYQFLDRDLQWEARLPGLWKRVPTSQRVLIVEACFAERLTAAVHGIPGFGLPAVGRDEWDWWGLRDTGGLILGATFTYFLARALEAQPHDVPLDFGAAFAVAVPGAQEYFRAVIATTPGALDSFHSMGAFPERQARFPNPHLLQTMGDPDPSARTTTPP